MDTKQSSMNPPHRTSPPSASHLNNDSSAQIGDEIEDTRSRMDETLDALGDRLSPRRLIDDVVDYFTGSSRSRGTPNSHTDGPLSRLSDSTGEFGRNLGQTVRDNPVPTVLIGAGLAWLAFGLGQDNTEEDGRSLRSKRRRLNRDRYFADTDAGAGAVGFEEEADDLSLWDRTKQSAAGAVDSVAGTASSAGQAISDAASTAGSTIGDVASATASGVSSAASSVAAGASSAVSATSEAAGSAYRGSRQAGREAYRSGTRAARSAGREISSQSQYLSENISDLAGQVSDKYQQASQQYPLAIGAGYMALGMLAGLVVPRTQRENQWMGDTSDSLKDDVWQVGEELVERGQHVASEAVDKASQSAEEHGLTGESLLERGKRVVSKVAAAASEAVDEEDLTAEKLAGDIKSVGQETGATLSTEATKAAQDVKSSAAKLDPDVEKPGSE